ncbi:MAG: pentapeptide repeat-containing protein [Chloroflexota bacterium]
MLHTVKVRPNLVEEFWSELETYEQTCLDPSALLDYRGFNFPSFDSAWRQDFLRDVNFDHATFSGDVNFGFAKFHSDVSFENATFTGLARFNYTKIRGNASFEGATFQGNASFELAMFGGDASFDFATIETRLAFGGETFGATVSFRSLVVHEKANISFRWLEDLVYEGHRGPVDLTRSSFLHTNIEKFEFGAARWQDRPEWWGLRHTTRCLSDEFSHDPGELLGVSQNYAQLVLNHQAKRDYEAAEDFHIGEMECRRKALGASWPPFTKWLRRRLLNSYIIYRTLSNYGSSWPRALFWLLLAIVGFAGGVWLTGGLTDLRPGATSGTVVTDYESALLYIASIAAFQRDRFYEPTTTAGRWIASGAAFAILGQFALVLFALRRRFKRD